MAAKKRRRGKKSLETIHRQLKLAYTKLEKLPAYKVGEAGRLQEKLKKLRKEQSAILGIPHFGD